MSTVTELDVLIAARTQIERGYTNSGYVQAGDTLDGADEVTSASALKKAEKDQHIFTCAIGGVEHALYKLTGKLIDETTRNMLGHIGAADDPYGPDEDTYVVPESRLNRYKDEQKVLYGKTLLRLNKIAVEEGWYGGIEEPNVKMSPEASKPIVLGFYDKAIEQVKAEQV